MQSSQRLLSLVAYPVSEFRQKPGDLDAWHAPCSEWRAREQKTGASVMRNDPIRAGLTRRAALATAGATALAASIPPVRAAEGNTIRVAFPAPVATLDPAKFRVGGLEYNYAHCVFNRLTAQDAKLQVIPELAASWEATEDLKIWIFHLRPDVKFHNGKPFSADDVAFTYRRLMDRRCRLVLRAALGVVSKVEASIRSRSVHAVGALFRPRRRHRAVPGQIVCEAAMDTLTTKPVGTGPFRFVEYRPGDQLVVERTRTISSPARPRSIVRSCASSRIYHRGGRSRERCDRHRLRSPPEQVDLAQGQQGRAGGGGFVRHLARPRLQQRVQAIRRSTRARGLHQAHRPAGVSPRSPRSVTARRR